MAGGGKRREGGNAQVRKTRDPPPKRQPLFLTTKSAYALGAMALLGAGYYAWKYNQQQGTTKRVAFLTPNVSNPDPNLSLLETDRRRRQEEADRQREEAKAARQLEEAEAAHQREEAEKDRELLQRKNIVDYINTLKLQLEQWYKNFEFISSFTKSAIDKKSSEIEVMKSPEKFSEFRKYLDSDLFKTNVAMNETENLYQEFKNKHLNSEILSRLEPIHQDIAELQKYKDVLDEFKKSWWKKIKSTILSNSNKILKDSRKIIENIDKINPGDRPHIELKTYFEGWSDDIESYIKSPSFSMEEAFNNRQKLADIFADLKR